jgi:DNA (cytosine-5)-methyltransferase 1
MGEGTRSGLAFAFLDLVAVHNPPLILLENVPGLLSSHGGRDMAVLFGTMVELGYGVAYRVLNAQFFGVPQRRRRVFIVGIKADGRDGAERAAEVLSVGSRCRRHPQTGGEKGTVAAAGISHSVTGTSGKRHDTDTDTDTDTHIVSPTLDASLGHHGGSVGVGDFCTPVDSDRVREIDGLARWLDDPKQDAHRYRCCGNGVVANVAEWLGWRLRTEAER